MGQSKWKGSCGSHHTLKHQANHFSLNKQPRDDVYGAYDASYMQDNGPKQNTQQPIVTGTSVVAIKFKDGVVMAADNLGAYQPFCPVYHYNFTVQSN